MNFEGQNEVGKFLRLLFGTHELGSQYIIVKIDQGEYKKVVTDHLTFRVQEVYQVSSSKGIPMDIMRLVNDGDQIIKEHITVSLTQESDNIGKEVIKKYDSLSKAMVKLKRKVKLAKEAVGLPIREGLTEDSLDYLAKQKIPGELEDLINITFPDNFEGFGYDKKAIKLFYSGAERSAVKTVEVDSLKKPRMTSISELNPRLSTSSEILKIAGVSNFVDLFRTTLVEEQIIQADDFKNQELRKAEYTSITK